MPPKLQMLNSKIQNSNAIKKLKTNYKKQNTHPIFQGFLNYRYPNKSICKAIKLIKQQKRMLHRFPNFQACR